MYVVYELHGLLGIVRELGLCSASCAGVVSGSQYKIISNTEYTSHDNYAQIVPIRMRHFERCLGVGKRLMGQAVTREQKGLCDRPPEASGGSCPSTARAKPPAVSSDETVRSS